MKNSLVSALAFSAFIVALAFALKYMAAHGLIEGNAQEISTRIVQVIVGLLVVWVANLTPKRLKPLSEMACDPASEQRGRRFAGAVIMLGGLVYSLTWLVAPAPLAFPIAISALGGTVAIVLIQCLAAFARR